MLYARPICNVKFEIMNSVITPNPLHYDGGQIISIGRTSDLFKYSKEKSILNEANILCTNPKSLLTIFL